ncbi:MAG: NAD(P)-dependent alcohol dehydrogenase [Nitrospirota bacterium]|nr:NAD(P)-dependent alcohol dehydrogenase [Nitrospirota bacterium]MDH5586958.1 NAD(P)-dependent alcohol dehydrogenase [Nitrospirota bacterium]
MLSTKGYAAQQGGAVLGPFTFERREVGPNDVLIQIRYCGVCHSDIHQARDEWGGAIFPMVPGHEIVGTVEKVGAEVKKFKVGDSVGVGCFVDSCRTCTSCTKGLEQYCETGMIFTYNGMDKNGQPTYGGYSNHIVVDEHYALTIPAGLALEGVAPLLCAGITTYSPLRQWGVGKGHMLAVVGLGGLGHMAVKIGRALGAEVTVLSRSDAKRDDAKRLGASDYAATSQEGTFARLARTFDFVIDTISAPHDLNAHLDLLKTDGTYILVGASPESIPVSAFSLILRRRRLVGSLIGGIRETQEMLDFCGEHGLTSDVEVIPITQINEAYERVIRGDVKFRFVIDMASLGQ